MALSTIPGSLKMIVMEYVNLDEAFNYSCVSSVCEPTKQQRKRLISSSTIWTSMAFVARCRGGAKCCGPCRIAPELVNATLAAGGCKGRLHLAASQWTFEEWAYKCHYFNLPFKALMAPLYYHLRLDQLWRKQMARPLCYAACSRRRCGNIPSILDGKMGYLCCHCTVYYYKKGRCDEQVQNVLTGVPKRFRYNALSIHCATQLVPGTAAWPES